MRLVGFALAVMMLGVLCPRRGKRTGHQLPQRFCRFRGPDIAGEHRSTFRVVHTVDAKYQR